MGSWPTLVIRQLIYKESLSLKSLNQSAIGFRVLDGYRLS